jgi:hypothetical protein
MGRLTPVCPVLCSAINVSLYPYFQNVEIEPLRAKATIDEPQPLRTSRPKREYICFVHILIETAQLTDNVVWIHT